MFKKILFNSLLIFTLCFSGCEEFYSFEAKKLNKKAEELVEESKIITDTDEKIILLSSFGFTAVNLTKNCQIGLGVQKIVK